MSGDIFFEDCIFCQLGLQVILQQGETIPELDYLRLQLFFFELETLYVFFHFILFPEGGALVEVLSFLHLHFDAAVFLLESCDPHEVLELSLAELFQ